MKRMSFKTKENDLAVSLTCDNSTEVDMLLDILRNCANKYPDPSVSLLNTTVSIYVKFNKEAVDLIELVIQKMENKLQLIDRLLRMQAHINRSE